VIPSAIKDALKKSQIDCDFILTCGNDIRVSIKKTARLRQRQELQQNSLKAGKPNFPGSEKLPGSPARALIDARVLNWCRPRIWIGFAGDRIDFTGALIS
jgi:hypothetical protein